MTAVADKALSVGLPAAVDAERITLNACVHLGTIPPAVEALVRDDFTGERRKLIFKAMRQLLDLSQPIDVTLLTAQLERSGDLDRIDGVAGLSAELDGVPVFDNVGEYVGLIVRAAKLRKLVGAADSFGRAALDRAADPDALIEGLAAKLEQIRHSDAGLGPEAYGVAALDAEFNRFADDIDRQRLRLGLPDFDDATGGLAPGEVFTLLARTAVGKSAIAQNVLQRVLEFDPEAGAVFFSLEMPRTLAYQRQLQIFAGIQGDAVIHSYRMMTAAARREEFRERFSGRLLINDDATLDLGAMVRFVKAAQASGLVEPVRLVVVDYLGLLDRGGRGSATERVSLLAREVKQFAKRLDCAVLLICQTNRTAGDGSHEVTITDARDSGAVEDSADSLVGAWRPDLDPKYDGEDFGCIKFATLKARRGAKRRWSQAFDGPTLRLGGGA